MQTRIPLVLIIAAAAGGAAIGVAAEATLRASMRHVADSAATAFAPHVEHPKLHGHDFIHPLASVIGAVELGERVFVAPSASVRGDEGQPIAIGDDSNIQDGVVIHALETHIKGREIEANEVTVDGRRYAVYIGARVSLAHQAQVHGPALIEDGSFVGMQALVFRAHVGKSCVLEPRALVMGVNVPPGRYVPAGRVVTRQADADALPRIDEAYPLSHLNDEVVDVNKELAEKYAARFQ